MDYDREDQLAYKRAKAGEESARRRAAGEYPFTILEAAGALGLDPPVSHDDLVVLGRLCMIWGVETNLDRDRGFAKYRTLD